MEWEWYYMRDISGSKAGRDVEAAFHQRMHNYIEPDGGVWSHPGCYCESKIDAVYGSKDYVFHTWGATKILKSLSEDYLRTGNPQSKELARKVMLALKERAVWEGKDRCYFTAGMGAYRRDGSIVPSWWNIHPAPIVEPLITYYQATGDPEGLAFAHAYAEGIIHNLQPDAVRFLPDGSFPRPAPPDKPVSYGHSHVTMHGLWGVAHLGLITGRKDYLEFVKRSWDWFLTRGTGTGWFPAQPDSCNETCCVSDMLSNAACIAQNGHPEYYDYMERYFRNHIHNQQFFVTPEFEAYYRRLHASADAKEVEKGLDTLRKFQGGIIGGTGINDFENELLGGTSGYKLFGCCAPEGMRAIHTAWTNTILRLPAGAIGPEGVYMNLCFSRPSPWGEVVSFFPDEGRLTVKASVKDTFFLRPPHWAPADQVKAFVNAKPITLDWSGAYVRFQGEPGDELTITWPLMQFTHRAEGLWPESAPQLAMTFQWLGNMVVGTDPAASKTPLYIGKPRILPLPPEDVL
ncbi:MAG: glycoside hydrolase family 127 protein, partial [Phycisphaerae bacterium]|nr:glycoside hydrolase family 127 protein [Phycisphaerae bacterium]